MSTEKPLSAKEICAILDACASAGVSHFQYGTLSVSFETNPAKEIAGSLQHPTWLNAADQTPLDEFTPNPHDDSPPELTEEEEADLFINDPAAWERRKLEE